MTERILPVIRAAWRHIFAPWPLQSQPTRTQICDRSSKYPRDWKSLFRSQVTLSTQPVTRMSDVDRKTVPFIPRLVQLPPRCSVVRALEEEEGGRACGARASWFFDWKVRLCSKLIRKSWPCDLKLFSKSAC